MINNVIKKTLDFNRVTILPLNLRKVGGQLHIPLPTIELMPDIFVIEKLKDHTKENIYDKTNMDQINPV